MDFEVINATTTDELLKAIADNQNNDFRFGAGYTDLINHFNHQPIEGLTVINIAELNETAFNSISEEGGAIVLGALVTASDLINSKLIEEQYPVLYQAAASVASTQIRNSATIGGNICNASPSADMSAALVALQANCTILNTDGNERTEPLLSFIQGVGKTSLAKNEVLQSISIPKNTGAKVNSGFEKIGTRNSMEISIVSLSYHIQMDGDGTIEKVGVSCGAVAPIIPFATSACEFLIGKNNNDISDADKEEFAKKVLEYASPISDVRASDWYRKEVLFNICQTIFS
jgi:CO/xanthine dehydrogenase FAD-binding subunit